MGEKIILKLDVRDVHGKKVKRLRKEGQVPGVVYGAGFDPISVQAASNVITKAYSIAGKHHPVHLTIGEKKKIAMIKGADIDPVKHVVRHVSFHAVKQNEPVEAEIPVHLKGEGESEAEKAGLIILQNIESLQVKALPMDLPDELLVDITGLKEPGERVTVADIKLPGNVELVDHAAQTPTDEDEESHSVTELVVASVWEPSALQAANEAAAGSAEPEDEAEAVAEVESEHGEDTNQPATASDGKGDGHQQFEKKGE
jgi:large subunit ribosomal protein L25